MKKEALLFLALIIGMVCLSAQNYMDLMTTLYGEFIGSYFGRTVVSLDFNGDGYDDLVVASSHWNPTGVYNENIRYGKIYFYWGGPGFDNIPDFVIEGTYTPQFGNSPALINAGDLNNDGFDDLIIRAISPDVTQFMGVYLGRANPVSTPDIVWSAPGGVGFIVYALGDINSDLKDDLSITYSIYNSKSRTYYLYIWDDIYSAPYLFRSGDWTPLGLLGIGDVNGDDIDDCHLSEPIYGQHSHFRKVAFFGTTGFPQADSLVLEENVTAGDPRACALGDINGDGYDDFSSYGLNVHLGSTNLSPSPSFTLITPEMYWGYNYNNGLRLVYGDFNGDGYDDIVASDHRWSYFDGDVLLWLGGQNVNGTYDLRLAHPQVADNFGYSKATGDFNGDGLSDLAVSAPFFWDEGSGYDVTPGKVYIYSGNTSLADTTVGNDDELAPAISCMIRVFPNPLLKSHALANVELSGSAIRGNDPVSLELYNLKGQIVNSLITKNDLTGQVRYQINCEGLATGIYFILAKHGNERLGSTKLLIY